MTNTSNQIHSYKDIKLIAFYLPQFHPIPENDLWWGKGFTEWTNVTKATAQFPGHYQPQLPTELSFYDLRLSQSRRDQIELAKKFGIGGFCYYYYWFSGKRLLNQPLDDMLSDPDSNMPFCLCWANENWTRRWDGRNNEVLIEQKYRGSDDLAFIKSVIPFLQDKRQIRVDGKPLLLVYAPQGMPNTKRSLAVWRQHCRDVGIGEIAIYCSLIYGNWEYERLGFDGGVEFPPHPPQSGYAKNLRSDVNHFSGFSGNIFSCSNLGEEYLRHLHKSKNIFRTVLPSWDNTARRGQRAAIGLNGSPENYEYWLSHALQITKNQYPDRERLVFINAWNEWAEGCHLEPCRNFGRAFLEATLRAKSGDSKLVSWTHIGIPEAARLTSQQSRRATTIFGRLRRTVTQFFR